MIVSTEDNNNQNFLVTVIIPTYNHAVFVKDAVNSVLAQTYLRYEIIVIDDGSTDNCKEVIEEFGDKVNYIWQSNQGLGGARNTGILAARGELIALLDADDEWYPDYLEKMVAVVNQVQAAVYHCNARGMDSKGQDLPLILGRSVGSPDNVYHDLLRANYIIPSTVLVRRSVLLEHKMFEASDRAVHGCEDWDLWLRIARMYRIVGTNQCLVRYRIHDHSLSANPEGMRNAVKAVIERHVGIDDGQWSKWPEQKKRAWGGVYRYNVVTSIKRKGDWKEAVEHFRCALEIDPSISTDLNLFYDLSLGSRPTGYGGDISRGELNITLANLATFFEELFASPGSERILQLKNKVIGTAYFGFALVAYKSLYLSLCRKSLVRAVFHRPVLIKDNRTINYFTKSLLGRSLLYKIRTLSDLK